MVSNSDNEKIKNYHIDLTYQLLIRMTGGLENLSQTTTILHTDLELTLYISYINQHV
jgi:hypothetical protein